MISGISSILSTILTQVPTTQLPPTIPTVDSPMNVATRIIGRTVEQVLEDGEFDIETPLDAISDGVDGFLEQADKVVPVVEAGMDLLDEAGVPAYDVAEGIWDTVSDAISGWF